MELQINNNDNIIIRDAKIEDASLLLNWWNDGDIMGHAGFPLGLKTTIDKVCENISQNNEFRELGIIEINNIPVGEINYKIENNCADFGIKICNKNYQNGGFGTKILKMFFDYLFKVKNVDKITCDTNLKNIRAQLVYEKKMGMRRIKTEYNCWTDQVGERQSATFFEITKEQYLSNQSK